jgi:hypothetical protein
MDHLHVNNLFLELELNYVSNTNSLVELLYGGICGAELQKQE